MKALNRLVKTNLQKNKKRTLATLVSIVLSCTLLFTISFGFSTIEYKNIEDAISFNGTHHVAFRDIEYKKSYNVLSNDKDISRVVTVQEIDSIYYREVTDDIDSSIRISSCSDSLEDYITLATGRFPKNSNEIIISAVFSLYDNYKIGDKIENYTITGIYNKDILGNEYIKKNRNMFYSPLVYTQSILNENNLHTTFYVTYKNMRKAYEKIIENSNSLGLNYTRNTLVDYENVKPNKAYLSANHIEEDEEGHLKTYLFLAVVLYVLSMFCIVIIYNSFSISLGERKKQFGILRSLGASKRQISRLVAREVVILGLISVPIAFFLSFTLVEAGIFAINSLMNIDVHLHVYALHIFICLFFIAFTITISAMTPARKAKEVSPIEAIRATKDFSIKKSRSSYPLIKRLFGIEGEIAYKNIKRNGKKFTATVLSLSISIVLFITTSAFLNSMITGYQNSYEEEVDIEIQLSSTNSQNENENFLKELKKLEHIDEFFIIRKGYLETQSEDYETEYKNNENKHLTILSFDSETFEKYKKQTKIKEDNYILYNLFTAFDNNGNSGGQKRAYKENPKITVCENNLKESCYFTFENLHTTLENYFNIFDSPTIIVNEREYDYLVDEYIGTHDRNFSSETEKYSDYLKNNIRIMINSKKFQKLDKEIEKLLNEHTNMSISYQSRAMENYENRKTLFAIKLILYSILTLIAIISLVGMLNSINTNLFLRETEFSILRSIGLSKRGLNKMIKLENIFIISKTLLIGIPISLIIVISINFFSRIQTIPGSEPTVIPIPWIYIFISILVMIIAILIATTFTSKKIKNHYLHRGLFE